MTNNVWIVSVDEPLYYGRLYRRIVEARPDKIKGVVVLPGRPSSSVAGSLRELVYLFRFAGARAFLTMSARFAKARARGSGDFARAAKSRGIPVTHASALSELSSILTSNEVSLALATVPLRVPPALLEAVPLGWVNTHCGPLPRYRGLNAPFWCLYHDEPRLAVTLHLMAEEFDAGPILGQVFLRNDGTPFFTLLDALFDAAYHLHVDLLDDVFAALRKQRPQTGEATVFHKPPAELGRQFRRRGKRFV